LAKYQKLPIEKEQRLRDLMKFTETGNSNLHALMKSRSWRLVLALD
jgi:hypothetical protein